MDKIERGISEASGLRFVYVDVTKTAKTLEERHLSGPASSLILGEGLIAAALLSTNLKAKGERISFQLRVDGPIKGLCAEANNEGGLRGYTDIKIIDVVDEMIDPHISKILGSQGLLSIVHSNEKKMLASGQINIDPPRVKTAIARYFNHSEQVPTAIEFFPEMKNFHVNKMKGLMVQKMPGADTERFVEVLELFNNGSIRKELSKSNQLLDFLKITGLKDLKLLKSSPLNFSCHCSYKKSVAILHTLPEHDLKEMLKEKKPQKVVCHFCGETYNVKESDLAMILLEKSDDIPEV